MKKTILLVCCSAALHAQNPTPDTSFSGDGLQITSVWTNTFARCVATQADQKILVGGNMGQNSPTRNSHLIARYLTNGDLDPEFGTDGLVFEDSNNGYGIFKIVVLPDQKILVGGVAGSSMVGRLNTDGSWDTTFGINGIQNFENVSGSVLDMHVFDDGSFLVMGLRGHSQNHGIRLAKFTADGELDPAFGIDGIAVEQFNFERATPGAFVVQSDGNIVVAFTGLYGNTGQIDPYTYTGLARFTPAGLLDTSFGDSGKVLHNTYITRGKDIALDAQDGLIVIGEYNQSFADTGTDGNSGIIRFHADGTFDTSFNNGTGAYIVDLHEYMDYSSAVEVDAHGKIYFAGNSVKTASTIQWYRCIIRLNADGTPDATFGTNGVYLSNIPNYNGEASNGRNNLTFTSNGKLVVAGFQNAWPGNRISVAQFIVDTTLGSTEPVGATVQAYPNPVNDWLYFSELEGNYTVRVYQIDGKLIAEAKNQTQLYTADWAKGIYHVAVESEEGKTQIFKIVK